MIKLKLLTELEYPLARGQDMQSFQGMEGWKGKLVWMTPEKFLGLAYPLPDYAMTERSYWNLRHRMLTGLPVDFLALKIDPVKKKVIGHEGRHRATVAKELGIKSVPVLIYFTEEYPRVPKWTDKEHEFADKAEFKPQWAIDEGKIYGRDFPMIVYHGGKMEAKKPVIFVTRHLNVAQSYANNSNGKVHKFELNIKNPAGNEIVDEIGRKLGIVGLNAPDELSHEFLSPEMVGPENVQKVIDELKKLGYDSAWVNGDFTPDDSFNEYDSFVIWNGSQLKPLGIVDDIKENKLIMEARATPVQVVDFIRSQIKGTEWDGKVFAVGGFVRDQLLGKEPKDLDVVVHKFQGGVEFNNWLAKKLGIYKEGSNPVIYPTFGTSNLRLDGVVWNGIDFTGESIDAVMFRKEQYHDPDSRKPTQVQYTDDIRVDASRRDITFNALYKDISTGKVLDPTGMGFNDLKNKIVRTSIDPTEIYTDDALRMFRAVRFATQLGFDLSPEIVDGIKKNLHRLGNTSMERVREELNKILTSKDPARGIRLLRDVGLLPYVAKELQQAVGMTQNVHHTHDVFDHTLAVLSKTKPEVVNRLMALFHDIGKVVTRSETPTGVHFYGHEDAGADIVEKILRNLKYPNEIINAVKLGVANHMRLKQGGDDAVKLSDKSLRKFKIELGDTLETVLDVIHADNIAHADASAMPNQIDQVRKRLAALDVKVTKPNLPINGNDLLAMGVPQGKMIGKILSVITDAWYANPNISKEEAIQIAKEIMGQS